MLLKTHLAFTLFICLLFFSSTNDFFFFLFISLIATLIPDLDTPNSKVGHFILFRPFNFFTKHRGLTHSLIVLTGFSSLLFVFFKKASIPFAIGYCSHLFLDCLTVQGVNIFYPFKLKLKGILKTNGIFEKFLLGVLILLNFFLLFKYFFDFL